MKDRCKQLAAAVWGDGRINENGKRIYWLDRVPKHYEILACKYLGNLDASIANDLASIGHQHLVGIYTGHFHPPYITESRLGTSAHITPKRGETDAASQQYHSVMDRLDYNKTEVERMAKMNHRVSQDSKTLKDQIDELKTKVAQFERGMPLSDAQIDQVFRRMFGRVCGPEANNVGTVEAVEHLIQGEASRGDQSPSSCATTSALKRSRPWDDTTSEAGRKSHIRRQNRRILELENHFDSY